MTFSKDDLETILYSLEGYIQGNDDSELCDKLVDICYRIEDELAPVVNNEENEHSLGNTNNGASIISATTQNNEEAQDQVETIVVEDINHKWAVESFNRDLLDLETLRVFFTDHAIKNALTAHLREYGPDVINGVNYKKILD